LPIDPDDPGDIGGISGDGGLHKTDRLSGVVGPDDPVVPGPLPRGRAGDLGPVLALESGEGGRLAPGEVVEVPIGENRDHLGGIGCPKRR
jgi:hypothetical protein